MVKGIPLTQGQVALVSDEDYDTLIQWKWHAALNQNGRDKFYVVRSDGVLMHRLIATLRGYALDGLVIDHVNLNSLDNRAENLRVCTHRENLRNRDGNGGSSIFRGVHLNKQKSRWQVMLVGDEGKSNHHGFYESSVIAAVFANDVIRHRDGRFARLNDIPFHIELLARQIPKMRGARRNNKEILAQLEHAERVERAYSEWLIMKRITEWQASAANSAAVSTGEAA